MSIDIDLETPKPRSSPYPWTTASTTQETVLEFLDSLSEQERKELLKAAGGGIQHPFKVPQTVLA
jgi:hypothetical protein